MDLGSISRLLGHVWVEFGYQKGWVFLGIWLSETMGSDSKSRVRFGYQLCRVLLRFWIHNYSLDVFHKYIPTENTCFQSENVLNQKRTKRKNQMYNKIREAKNNPSQSKKNPNILMKTIMPRHFW